MPSHKLPGVFWLEMSSLIHSRWYELAANLPKISLCSTGPSLAPTAGCGCCKTLHWPCTPPPPTPTPTPLPDFAEEAPQAAQRYTWELFDSSLQIGVCAVPGPGLGCAAGRDGVGGGGGAPPPGGGGHHAAAVQQEGAHEDGEAAAAAVAGAGGGHESPQRDPREGAAVGQGGAGVSRFAACVPLKAFSSAEWTDLNRSVPINFLISPHGVSRDGPEEQNWVSGISVSLKVFADLQQTLSPPKSFNPQDFKPKKRSTPPPPTHHHQLYHA